MTIILLLVISTLLEGGVNRRLNSIMEELQFAALQLMRTTIKGNKWSIGKMRCSDLGVSLDGFLFSILRMFGIVLKELT